MLCLLGWLQVMEGLGSCRWQRDQFRPHLLHLCHLSGHHPLLSLALQNKWDEASRQLPF